MIIILDTIEADLLRLIDQKKPNVQTVKDSWTKFEVHHLQNLHDAGLVFPSKIDTGRRWEVTARGLKMLNEKATLLTLSL